ncbi:hypothetical protein AB1Y20_005641 [Prymnesium parvum]|uniref:NADPH-dependent FMN reductase-like domain-containing protein n=1 Tax=Prymnesium parvum TaxID=97485 RepID=A0AB34J3X6_PRYPA
MRVNLRDPVVALFSGSSRVGSLNTKLLDHAATLLRARGATVLKLHLQDYRLPLFSQDLEATAFPEGAKRLKADLTKADGFLCASPEYNGFPSPALVNAITWATRGEGGMYDAFQGKIAVVVSASPGPMGGLRGLNPTRELLQNCGVNCLATPIAVGHAHTAFKEDGSLVDAKQEARLATAMGQLHHFTLNEANRDAQCEIVEEAKRLGYVGQNGEVCVPQDTTAVYRPFPWAL